MSVALSAMKNKNFRLGGHFILANLIGVKREEDKRKKTWKKTLKEGISWRKVIS